MVTIPAGPGAPSVTDRDQNQAQDPHAVRSGTLSKVGESTWADWIRQDLEEWDRAKSVRHHLSAYGGMGSFNDVVLSPLNGHQMSPEAAPWISATFEDLKSICHLLARFQESVVPGLEKWRLEKGMGPVRAELIGWKCETCGYRETTPTDIEAFLARREVRPRILEATEKHQLSAFVEEVTSGRYQGRMSSQRQELTEKVEGSGIAIRPREGWMRPCPKCGSDNTAVAYWKASGPSGRFQETSTGSH